MNQSTILIADDDARSRIMLEGLLRFSGYTLLSAVDGYEALKLAVAHKPDVILLDVMMPGINGFEVCERLRAIPDTADIPILMVTALDDRDALLQGLSAGADDFISKPYDRVELRMRLQTITRLNRYRQLTHTRERLSWVLEHAVEGYAIIDAAGMITYASPQARGYLGLPNDPHAPLPSTLLSYAQRMYACEPTTAWHNWPHTRAGETPRYLVLPETSETAAFWLQVDVLPARDDSPSEQLIRLRNVTAQMALQRSTNSFHSIIAHKLRTPLIGMLTSTELLAHFNDQLPPEEVKSLAIIASASLRRMRDQIDDVLEYVSIASLAPTGEGTPITQVCDLIKTTEASLQLAPIATACQRSLDHYMVTLSARTVELILLETCENAKKFHPQHSPTIEILLMKTDNNMLAIQVRDDGVTLTPQQLDLVWTPYYQAEKSFTGQMPGMGLGLALVATLVWSAGGTCTITNRDDIPGVMVELALPLQHINQATLPTSSDKVVLHARQH